MTPEETTARLQAVKDDMAALGELAVRLGGNTVALEQAGLDMPNLREMVSILLDLTEGWLTGERL